MRTKYLLILFVASLVLSGVSCKSSMSAVDRRKQKLQRKKKHNPNDCPKVDC